MEEGSIDFFFLREMNSFLCWFFSLYFYILRMPKIMFFLTKSLVYIWYVFTVGFRSVEDSGKTEELMRISGSCVQGLCPTCWFLTLLFEI